MLTVARALTTITPAGRSFVNFYSTVSGLKRRNWGVGSVETPQSLVDVESQNTQSDPRRHSAFDPANRNGRLNQPHTLQEWRKHREAIKDAFPDGWAPPRKLSREAMDGLRAMHATNPEIFSTRVLAEKFRISGEAVRRILKSKWIPSREKRVKILGKERKIRAEYIEKKRVEERREMLSLLRERDRLDRALGKVRGVNMRDKLSLT